MKRNTLLVGAFMLLGTSPIFAQDLVIETMKGNPNIELIQNAKFDVGYGHVGGTSTTTLICLGEVDFGDDGNAYQATGVEFAQGWGSYENQLFVVLHAGKTYEESAVFNEMTAIRTFGYHCFEMFAENMKEGEGFVRPTGKQKVWLTFREGNGNLRSIKFYKDKVAEEGMQPWVNELPGYEDKAQIISGANFDIAVEVLPDGPFKDSKYNEEKECWGGIVTDFIVKSKEPIDFGNGDYQQLVAFIGHDGERFKEYMEFYIDEVKPENMIARSWSGINLQEWNSFTPMATPLEKVTGKHHLFVKWGDATNLHRIDLVKEKLWYENPVCGIIYEDAKPSENAVVYVTKGQGTKGGDPTQGEMEWSVVCPGGSEARGEGSNIGYTSNGVVVAYYDVDFKKGEYKRVVINHSCDKNWLGTIEESNLSLYIDLDEDALIATKNPEELKTLLADKEPIAVVRAQGTGGWGTKMATEATLKEVKDVHTVYVVYNIPSGVNVHGLYLDTEAGVGFQKATSMEGMDIYSVGDEIIVNTTEETNIAIYTMSGVLVSNKVLSAGNTTIKNLTSGLYIVKATNKEGTTVAKKVIIK